jgi:lysophospholipase L1-like esterase
LVLVLASVCVAPEVRAQRDDRSPYDTRWVQTWGAAMQAQLFGEAPTFENVTLRQIVRISRGGPAVRVRFSNVLGDAPLRIDAASVGVRQSGARVAAGTLRELTFGRLTSITIAPGAVAVSDPVELRVPDEADLAVSLYVAEASTPADQLTLAHQTSYVSGPGDFTDSRAFEPASTITSWYWLSGVEVRPSRATRAIVAFGDSITEGFGATLDANTRWPDFLARRLLACRRDLTVVNMAISGNRVLNDEIGPNAQRRLDRDMLAVTGVAYAILLEGINDIGFSQIAPGTFPPDVALTNVSAEEIIMGYKQIIRRAHAQGIKIYGGTLLPFVGAGYQDAAGEAKRQAVNFWIRTSGDFDEVIDFDRATRDPADPSRLLPAYDSGDHLHPNDAGFEAMAGAIDLDLFAETRGQAQRCN